MLASAQALANRYARERDCFGYDGAACISCGEWTNFEKLDGGHYVPATSQHSALRFDERNIHAQCHRCNRYLHANLRGYFRGLEKKLGRDGLDRLESEDGPHTWTQEEIDGIKTYYKQKLADLRAGIPPEAFLRVESVSQMYAAVRNDNDVPRLSDIYQTTED